LAQAVTPVTCDREAPELNIDGGTLLTGFVQFLISPRSWVHSFSKNHGAETKF